MYLQSNKQNVQDLDSNITGCSWISQTIGLLARTIPYIQQQARDILIGYIHIEFVALLLSHEKPGIHGKIGQTNE